MCRSMMIHGMAKIDENRLGMKLNEVVAFGVSVVILCPRSPGLPGSNSVAELWEMMHGSMASQPSGLDGTRHWTDWRTNPHVEFRLLSCL